MISLLDRLDLHMKEVVEGASVTFVMKGLAGALKFGLNLVAARMLGAEGAGLFFLALSITTVAATLSRLGLENVVLRFVAAGAAVDDWSEVKGVHRKSVAFGLSAGAAVAALLASTAAWTSETLFSKPGLALPLAFMVVAVPFHVLMYLQGESLKGLKRIFFSQLANGVTLPAVVVIGIWAVAEKWGVPGAAAVYTAGAVTAGGMGSLLWWRSTPDLSSVDAHFDTGRLVSTALPLLGVAALNLVMQWTSTLLLGAWGTSSEVAIFNVAHRTAMLVTLVLHSINSIAAPKFSELYRQGEIGLLGVITRNSTRVMLLLAVPVLGILVTAPGFVMSLFGPEFPPGAPVLVILALGQFVNVATGSVGFVLIMSGRERLYRNTVAVAAGVNLILNVVLIPRWGVTGAAWATAASLATVNLGAAVWVWRRLGINPVPVSLWESIE